MEMIAQLEERIFQIISDNQRERNSEVKEMAQELYKIYVGKGRRGTDGLMESLLRIEERCGPECYWAGPRMDKLFDHIGDGNDIWLA